MQEVHERARNYARKKIAGPFLLSEESRNFAIFLLGFHTPEKISPIQYCPPNNIREHQKRGTRAPLATSQQNYFPVAHGLALL